MSKSALPTEIIEHIVEHVFYDKSTDDGACDETGCLPKGFLRLATVSKAFVYPVRRAVYENLHIEGGERFLMLVGQLRFCPHLAHFVQTAYLNSTCKQLTNIDGHAPGSRDPTPFLISDRPVAWFLDACPRLTGLRVSGPDFIPALASISVARCLGVRRIKTLEFIACIHLQCEALLSPGWLAPMVAYPALEKLEIVWYRLRLNEGPLEGIERGSSTCTNLSIFSIITPLTQSLVSLVAAMPRLVHAHLEMAPLPSGGLRAALVPAASTLKELVLVDHQGEMNEPDAWELDVVASLPNLEVLELLNIPVRPTLFKHLPPKLRHLRLSFLNFLPASHIIAWLKGRFDHPSLMQLETVCMLKRDVGPGAGDKATPAQMDEIRSLCAARGIKWDHQEDWFGDDDESEEAGFAGPCF